MPFKPINSSKIWFEISHLGAAIQNNFYNFVDLQAHQKVF